MSQLSDVTDEVYPESVSGDPDLNDYNRLVQMQKQKMKILSDLDESTVAQSVAGDDAGPTRYHYSKKDEKSDEFLRNFFIKFNMKRTLESF